MGVHRDVATLARQADRKAAQLALRPLSEGAMIGITSDWRGPSELPDLRRVGTIVIDSETRDEGLRADRGSAWPWHGGYVCGISVAWRAAGEIRASYFPIRHPDSENFARANVARWLQDHIAAGVKFITLNG